MKKTEILYTRVTKENLKYLSQTARMFKLSRATCLDDMISFMKDSHETTKKALAKRRNQIQEAV